MTELSTSKNFYEPAFACHGERWTPEEDEYLIKHYRAKGRAYCAEKLKRTADAVCMRAHILRAQRQARNWKPEEDAVIASGKSIREMELALPNRTRKAIEHRVWQWKVDNNIRCNKAERAAALGKELVENWHKRREVQAREKLSYSAVVALAWRYRRKRIAKELGVAASSDAAREAMATIQQSRHGASL